MDQYIVSARKYRPSTFASVVGQKALSSTLKNAVDTGRLASSYLFCGSRGVGKTTCARIFAKAINCQHRTPDGEPCNECDSCRDFNNGSSMNIVEMDAASNNGTEDIRKLIQQVQIPPSSGRYRVFIIDEVHMLSSAAFNAFLKTLEEPPSYVVFILATTEKHKIIPTILSRCQIYDFHRITVNDMVDHLRYVASQEGITADDAALTVIARKADGAMRDALSIFDQVAASSRGNITYASAIDNLNMLDRGVYARLLQAILDGKVLDTWMIYKEVRDRGFDSLFFLNGLADYLRDIFAAATPETLELIDAPAEERKQLAEIAAKCTPGFLFHAMDLCNEADMAYRTASGKQFLIELTLAKICQLLSPSPDDDIDGSGEGHLRPIAVNPDLAPAPEASRTMPPQPAPQQAPQPAQAPAPHPPRQPYTAPQPHAKPLARPNISLRGPAISINPKNKFAQPTPTGSSDTPSQHTSARNTPFATEALNAAWQTFIAAHPKHHVLINAMQSCPPTLASDGSWLVTVFNTFQRDELLAHKQEIETLLRNTLANDTIRISVEVSQGAPPRHTLSDRDLLAAMAEAHPMLGRYISELNLKL